MCLKYVTQCALMTACFGYFRTIFRARITRSHDWMYTFHSIDVWTLQTMASEVAFQFLFFSLFFGWVGTKHDQTFQPERKWFINWFVRRTETIANAMCTKIILSLWNPFFYYYRNQVIFLWTERYAHWKPNRNNSSFFILSNNLWSLNIICWLIKWNGQYSSLLFC